MMSPKLSICRYDHRLGSLTTSVMEERTWFKGHSMSERPGPAVAGAVPEALVLAVIERGPIANRRWFGL